MSRERRNHYRLLYVQPEAPPEVIKAAYRALMGSTRVHPDLGGGHEQAARLNAAYAVLSDPEARRAYDLSLRRPARGGATPPPAPAAPTGPHCAFCLRPFHAKPQPDTRCAGCHSPLFPAPTENRPGGGAELLGRRRGERFACDRAVELRLPAEPRVIHTARLRDLSFTGLSLFRDEPLPVDSVLRVRAAQFETVARVVGSRRHASGHTVHAHLLTLELLPGARGVYVDARA